MAIKVASVSETWTRDVFTDRGVYCGKLEDVECDLKRYKLRSLVVRAMKGSYLSNMLGDKKGVIIPFSMVEAIGDIVIIKHILSPESEAEPQATEQPAEASAEAMATPAPA